MQYYHSKRVIGSYTRYILPVMNPDGYLYSWVKIDNIYSSSVSLIKGLKTKYIFDQLDYENSASLLSDPRPNVAKDPKTKQRELSQLRWHGREQELGIPLERDGRSQHRSLLQELHGTSPFF